MERIDGRAPDEMRPVSFQPGIAPHATGSVLVSFGDTQVICAVTIENKVPRWMMQQNVSGGWLTAEYNMLPYSTLERKTRDIAQGRIDGRSSEIQRLIGRSLRAVVDLGALGNRTVWVDCDVLRADGGTRTASISGACVAAEMAFRRMAEAGALKASPMKQLACAISAGLCGGEALLDLNYPEDRDASVDFNYVMTETLDLIEVQGAGEEATFTEAQMMRMLELSKEGARRIAAFQREALAAFDPRADEAALARLRQ